MSEPAVHLSPRASCYLDILFPSPTTLKSSAPPYTSHSPLLPTGKALGAAVLTRHLDHLPPPGGHKPQPPSVLRAPPADHVPRPPRPQLLPLAACAFLSCSCLSPPSDGRLLKDGPVPHPPQSFRVTPSAAELATAGTPCPTTRKLVSLCTFLGLRTLSPGQGKQDPQMQRR